MENEIETTRSWLKPWYRSAVDNGRVLLQHGDELTILQGKAVNALLVRMLPLLDGSRDAQEIAMSLGVAEEPVSCAIALLRNHGLLTDGPRLSAAAPARVQSDTYLLTSLTPWPSAPLETWQAIAKARVGVVGSGGMGDVVMRLARKAGVGATRRIDLEELNEGSRTPDFVIVAPRPDELDLLESVNSAALRSSVAWLPLVPFDGKLLAVGPLIVPNETCCWDCFRFRRVPDVEAAGDFLIDKRLTDMPGPCSFLDEFAGGLAGIVMLRWLAYRDPFLPGMVNTLQLTPEISLQRDLVYRVPRCGACSATARQPTPLPWHEGQTSSHTRPSD